MVPNPAAAPGNLLSFLTARSETLGVWLGFGPMLEFSPTMHELSLIPSTAEREERKKPRG